MTVEMKSERPVFMLLPVRHQQTCTPAADCCVWAPSKGVTKTAKRGWMETFERMQKETRCSGDSRWPNADLLKLNVAEESGGEALLPLPISAQRGCHLWASSSDSVFPGTTLWRREGMSR